jgi:aerobic-type carbon monoxide dehydrogenase small subunit (CoxS/CutS family)
MNDDFELNVNGYNVTVNCSGVTPLALVLRNKLGLRGTRIGCALEQCGACTVLIDGTPAPSCSREVQTLTGHKVTSVEGLSDDRRRHPVLLSLVEEQAGQCGFCLAGIAVAAAALLRDVPHPTLAEVVSALDGHLCRCGSHNRIIRAVMKACKEPGDDCQHSVEEPLGQSVTGEVDRL